VINEAYEQAKKMYNNETVNKNSPTPIVNVYVPSQDTLLAIKSNNPQTLTLTTYDTTGKATGTSSVTTNDPQIRNMIKERLPYVLQGYTKAQNEIPDMANTITIQTYLTYVNDVMTLLGAAAAVGVASSAVLSGGGFRAIGNLAHKVLSVPPLPNLSSIVKNIRTEEQTLQNGGGKSKGSSVDDSIFLGLLAVITLGGMASAVLRSVPNRLTH
jgi:hypothetical protein